MRCAFTLLVILAGLASAEERQVRFSGTVSAAQSYRREIGAGLVFIIRPDGDGWRIVITSKSGCPDSDFAAVITPPYRFRNSLMINTYYGVMAKDAVRERHDFEFVLDCLHYRQESARLEKVLWPYSFADAEVEDATAKLGTSPKGKGRVKIVAAKIMPSDLASPGKNLGRIESMRFEVHLTVPE